MVHVDLLGPYGKPIRKNHSGRSIIKNNVSLTYMTIIDLATGWFKIVEISTFNLDEVTAGNDEYIDKSSAMDSQLLNNTWICRYPRPRKVVFQN